MSLDRVVVVGASLAGLRAAEELRRKGFTGELTLIGREDHFPPYDRPPLSKEILLGTWDLEQSRLRIFEELSAALLLGRSATELSVREQVVALDDGTEVPFDGLVVATGASVRNFRGPGHDLDGIHVMRGAEDCIGLRDALAAGPRVGIIGAGFIGAEIASCCRARGLDVTLVDIAQRPLSDAIGDEMADYMLEQHSKNGTQLRLGVGVAAIAGDGRVERIELADGSAIDVDVAVVGIGVAPEVAWLTSSDLILDNGVLCDEFCCALGTENIVAAGDVARWFNPFYGMHMRVEHWTNAVEQGEYAAQTLLFGKEGRSGFSSIPYFWSDQYGTRLQFIGQKGPKQEIVEGSLEEGKFVVTYERLGRIVGALCVNWPARLQKYRTLMLGQGPIGARA